MKSAGAIFVAGCFLLVMTSLSTAQTNACPLLLSSIKAVGPRFEVDLINMSSKQLASYRLGITFLEVNGKKHPFPEKFSDNVKVMAHGRRTAIWSSRLAEQFAFPVAKVYVEQATYSDGTEWLDDGTESCAVTSTEE